MIFFMFVLFYGISVNCGNDNISLRNGVRVGEYDISKAPRDCEKLSLGVTNCAEPVQDIFIDEVIPHPNYNHIIHENDIGLLRTSLPIKFSESVQAICLLITKELQTYNLTADVLTVTGWETTKAGSKSSSLMQVEIPVVPIEKCNNAYKTVFETNYRQICAGGVSYKDSCVGDNGGPLQRVVILDNEIVFVQFGIVSYGTKYCEPHKQLPRIYTRINYYMDWILNNIRS